MLRKILISILLFLSYPAYAADTLLIGWDCATEYNSGCWIDNATTINNGVWKANRLKAVASGTINHYQMRVPNTPTGCTNDSGCWAIYEGGDSSNLGALKAYNCFSGYNWTTLGVGQHTFDVGVTVTDLTVTAGQWYWVVFWSFAWDGTHYATAGCNQQILSYRGANESPCIDNLDNSTGWAGRYEQTTTVSSPPSPVTFNATIQTYTMRGIWASDETQTTQSISGADLRGVTLQ